MKIYENQTFDEERALYGSEGAVLKLCRFEGPADGESALKESANVESEYFMLRSNSLFLKNVKMKGKYAFQYVTDSVFEDTEFDTKDAFWHTKNVVVKKFLTTSFQNLLFFCFFRGIIAL